MSASGHRSATATTTAHTSAQLQLTTGGTISPTNSSTVCLTSLVYPHTKHLTLCPIKWQYGSTSLPLRLIRPTPTAIPTPAPPSPANPASAAPLRAPSTLAASSSTDSRTMTHSSWASCWSALPMRRRLRSDAAARAWASSSGRRARGRVEGVLREERVRRRAEATGVGVWEREAEWMREVR